MFDSIKNKFLDFVEYPADKMTEDTEIIKDLQMNSFDIVTMLGDIESEYNITFSQEDIESITTIGDLCKLIKEKL